MALATVRKWYVLAPFPRLWNEFNLCICIVFCIFTVFCICNTSTIIKMSIEFINWYWRYPAIIWGIYIIWRVSVRLSGGLRNIHFLICILVLDINSQHLGNICQLAGISVPPSGAGLGNLSRGGSCPPVPGTCLVIDIWISVMIICLIYISLSR